MATVDSLLLGEFKIELSKTPKSVYNNLLLAGNWSRKGREYSFYSDQIFIPFVLHQFSYIEAVTSK